MKQSLQLRLGQQLTMTPQLQQAIKLLQLSTLDLQQEIQEALDSNLMLELDDLAPEFEGGISEDHRNIQELLSAPEAGGVDAEIHLDQGGMGEDLPVDTQWEDVYDSYTPQGTDFSAPGQDDDTDFLALNSNQATLKDHLLWQLNVATISETDREIAHAIIDAINENGYLTVTLEELLQALNHLELGLDEVKVVLHRIQAFDPPGVGARDLRECLLLQLRDLPQLEPGQRVAMLVCRDHFSLLASRDFAKLRQRLKLTEDELSLALQLIRHLNPAPGGSIERSEPQYVVPDVLVSKRSGRWQVELNPEATPRLRVNADYANLIRRADKSDDNTCLKNHLQEARWFIKSLTSRNETVLRVASKIVEFQQGFFNHGDEAMRPLVLRDIAEALELHESTVSRVTTQKFMQTPRGTYEFKYFFSSQLGADSGHETSSTAIRALIKKLIAAEKPSKPLSDNKIAAVLADQGVQVARRTVAKYREAMGIAPSNERKRLL